MLIKRSRRKEQSYSPALLFETRLGNVTAYCNVERMERLPGDPGGWGWICHHNNNDLMQRNVVRFNSLMLEKCSRRDYEVKILCPRSCMLPVTCRAVTKRTWGVRPGFCRNLPVGILLLISRVPTFLVGYRPTLDFTHRETFDAIHSLFVSWLFGLNFLFLLSQWNK